MSRILIFDSGGLIQAPSVLVVVHRALFAEMRLRYAKSAVLKEGTRTRTSSRAF